MGTSRDDDGNEVHRRVHPTKVQRAPSKLFYFICIRTIILLCCQTSMSSSYACLPNTFLFVSKENKQRLVQSISTSFSFPFDELEKFSSDAILHYHFFLVIVKSHSPI
jgi:hypothetical protein